MPYVFSMTSRMVTIAASCALLLCALLFLLGFEIGARFVAPEVPVASAVSPGAAASARMPAPDAPAPTRSTTGSDSAGDSAPATSSAPSAASTY